jgi:hypothetical protein
LALLGPETGDERAHSRVADLVEVPCRFA